MSQRKKQKVLFAGNKENIFADKFKLKRCFNEMIYILTILCQGNTNERDEKLHYIPSSLNQTILVLPWTYNGLNSTFT